MKWTLEKLQEEADKYETRGEFWKKSESAATISRNKNLIDELFKNHINNGYTKKQVKEGYWTIEALQKEANKYETRGEFRSSNFKAYKRASVKKILDKLFEKHINNGYLKKEKYKENNYVIYVYEFKKYNIAYIGLTNDINRRDKQHIWNKKEKMSLYCKENNISLPKYKILEKELISNEAQLKEQYWIDVYKKNNWDLFNSSKGGALGGNKTKWNKNKLKTITKKYKNRNEFRINNNLAYVAACRKKILDELFENHPNNGFLVKRNGYWTKENIKKEAKKYKYRSDFSKYNGSVYNAALKLNILNYVFKNHKNNGFKIKKSEIK